MARYKTLEKGIAKCIRYPVGKAKEELGDDFVIHEEYSYKKVLTKLDEIEYHIEKAECNAFIFKQFFIITKTANM